MSQTGTVSDSGGTGGNDIRTITGNTGGAVAGDASYNVNLLGSGTITVTGNAGTNTLTITDASTVWSTVSTNTVMAINNGYICIAPGGTLNMLLPSTAPVGSLIEVTLQGATAFLVNQPAGVSVNYNSFSTTSGPTGNITSLAQGCSLKLVCVVANTTWQVLSSNGNFAVN